LHTAFGRAIPLCWQVQAWVAEPLSFRCATYRAHQAVSRPSYSKVPDVADTRQGIHYVLHNTGIQRDCLVQTASWFEDDVTLFPSQHDGILGHRLAKCRL
jgi:hypothetical protein